LDAGRLAVCCGASGGGSTAGGGLPSFQLAPVLAKLSADLLLGKAVAPVETAAGGESSGGGGGDHKEGPAQAARAPARSGGGGDGGGGSGDGESSSLVSALWARRPAVGLRGGWPQGAADVDTLEGLSALQRARPATAQERERAADEGSDRARDESDGLSRRSGRAHA
jgi:hypothetical protein